jgi:alkylation response protein AidB-like acyl-CoA dehydrogenase
MDFSWSDEEVGFKKAAIDFAKRELDRDAAARDEASEFPHDLWRKCAEFGVQGSAVPAEYGGLGHDIVTTMLIMEGLGHGSRDNGLLFALNAQMWAVQHPIVTFGTEEQKQKYLPPLCRGERVGAHGMTEPESGSDAYSLKTRAERRDGGYLLNGTKTMVTNAPSADLAVVFAATDPEKGHWGITGFLVERGTKGFGVSRNMHKMGMRTSTMGELILEDCWVPEANRLGKEGAGARVFASSMEWERACILGSHVGAMERQLEVCIAYSKERRQFGKPIVEFPPVAHRIADMKVRLETSRLLLYQVAWRKKAGRSAAVESAMAKLHISENFVASSLDAIRIHGGYGYLTEFEVERDLRDAVGGTLYSGTSDIQRRIIAEMLGVQH